jgi:hypothetical protein
MGADGIEKSLDFSECCNATISCICATLALPRLLFHLLHLQGITHIAAVIKAAYISRNTTVSGKANQAVNKTSRTEWIVI